jgi:hypothetical protein
MRSIHPALFSSFLALVVAGGAGSAGCSDEEATKPNVDAAVADTKVAVDTALPDAAANPACAASGKQTVNFTTDDTIKLEADLYLGGGTDGPAVVLLHMVPPSNDRTNYPQAFIDALTKKKITVLNVDRRKTQDAYQGPKGKLDAKAAYDYLAAHACPIDLTRVVFIGASNGTATALDFTVHAAAQAALKTPRGLVFLTGGGYTEAQNKIVDNLTLLKTLPILFVYSTVEATWSSGFKTGGGTDWEFLEYSGVTQNSGHGTLIFGSKPESIDAVATFVEKAVKK